MIIAALCAAALVAAAVLFVLYSPGRPRSLAIDFTGLIGEVGTAQGTFSISGKVLIRGELWQAESAGAIIETGDSVRVVGIKDPLTLVVVHVP